MTHNGKVELQGKCRRLTFAKIDGPLNMRAIPGSPGEFEDVPGSFQYRAGDVIDLWSAGGALEELSGDDFLEARHNDSTAPQRYGCIEEYFSPNPVREPKKVDLTKVESCIDAVVAHREAVQAEKDYVFNTSIRLFNAEASTTDRFRHNLKVQEALTRENPDPAVFKLHATIIVVQSQLEQLSKTCLDCCEQLLVTRDAAVTFAEPES